MNSTIYRRIDAIAGWLLFVAASIVYLLTMEPTASFWDCGEFIACADKLIVGHPPGAPFFMLLMRLFTMWAPTPEYVGVFANTMSALASGATIMFLYWTIAHLARRAVAGGNETPQTLWQATLIVGAAAVGALCYTFTDTFWFSAVEGEVYALSSLFTAVVFWAILKWEEHATEPGANRWIVLIALLMGLSIGVHLLNLLAIPAIVLVYYFQNYKFTWWGFIKALLAGGVILLAVLYGVIQGLVVVASWFELLFVNSFGLPFMSGALVFIVLLAAAVVVGLFYTRRRNAYMANLFLTCFAMLLLGYSSYAVILIRSLANPTLDQNGVDNVFSLKSYLNREQYGDRPLFTGPYFNAPVEDYKPGSPVYAPRGNRYEKVGQKVDVQYDKRFVTIFPRMWSDQKLHTQGYNAWVNIKGHPVPVTDYSGKTQQVVVPSFIDNLAFFFSYQVGFMYWRYFMWNFSGRQNDYQGYGHDAFRGNWISGIPFIDTPRLGNQNDLPEPYRSNKGRNRYFMLPLLLGIAGMVYHFRQRKFDATVVLTLFILTGIAIVVYLNQKPYEPRERDYTFAGSFYAFAIWVGLGVVPLAHWLEKLVREKASVLIAIGLSFAGVPLLMASQNWDDHDRSGRFIARDFARNMLRSVGNNGILFTYADNDTFPLWYAQEAEGFRRDVRVCNLTYLSGDWYVDVMARKAYEADPLPFGLAKEQYQEGVNDNVLISNRLGRPIMLNEALAIVRSDDPRTKVQSPFVTGGMVGFYPTNEFLLPAYQEAAKQQVAPQFAAQRLDTIILRPKGRYMFKNGFAVYNLLANNDWERPLSYSPMLPADMYWGLNDYFVRQGIVSAVLPVDNKGAQEMIDTAAMYHLLMQEYDFRGINDPKVYVDETCKRMIEYYIDAFSVASLAYCDAGDSLRGLQLVERCFEVLPPAQVGWSYRWLPLIHVYYRAGAPEKGRAALMAYATQCVDVVRCVKNMPRLVQPMGRSELAMASQVLQELLRIAEDNKDEMATQQLEMLFAGS